MTETELKRAEAWATLVHGGSEPAKFAVYTTVHDLTAEVRRLQAALTTTRLDFGRLIDAFVNEESLHETDDDGDDVCGEDHDACECPLPKLINSMYERLQEFR